MGQRRNAQRRVCARVKPRVNTTAIVIEDARKKERDYSIQNDDDDDDDHLRVEVEAKKEPLIIHYMSGR